MSYPIKELLPDAGDSPFAEWFRSLEAAADSGADDADIDSAGLGGFVDIIP